MTRSYPLWSLVAAALIFGPVGWRVLSWERPRPSSEDGDLASAGEVLFNHEWQPNDPLSPGGDGLGPVFNARSCVACHHQNGVGGSGGVEHNVTTFLVLGHDGRPKQQGVIHAFATAEPYQETLALIDASLGPISQPTLSQIVPGTARGFRVVKGGRAVGGEASLIIPPNVRISQLNTPALFGIGLIDLIPDQVIIANARQERLRFAMVPGDTETVPVGRVARLADGRIGRFGWKAQMATLSDFVQAACANELGLGNPGQAQPRSLAQLNYAPGGLDLTQLQCDRLSAFVAALPRPPNPSASLARIHAGKGLFAKIGCADCHAPSLGSVDGLYSDLLLHRMGTELESSNASYGTPIPTAPKDIASATSGPLPDEWRTPPLWGVADSAPYMHDGRATTLEEAIQMHGGQGAGAAGRFQQLSPEEQGQLITFLRSLRAS